MSKLSLVIAALSVTVCLGCASADLGPRTRSYEASLASICEKGRADIDRTGHLSADTVSLVEMTITSYGEYAKSYGHDALRFTLKMNAAATLQGNPYAAMASSIAKEVLVSYIPEMTRQHVAHVPLRGKAPWAGKEPPSWVPGNENKRQQGGPGSGDDQWGGGASAGSS
jgi:hypothetical protein